MTVTDRAAPDTDQNDPDAAASGHGPSHPGSGHRPASTALVFLLPAAVALAFSLRGIGDRQLWRDEHATWWAATLSFGDLGALIKNIDVVFAPYYIVMHLWVSAFGTSPTAMRIPAAGAMAVAAGLLGLVGRRMFTLRTGLLAGLLFAVVPTVIQYGEEVRPYAFAVAFALLSTLLLLRALDQPSLKRWALYGVSIPLVGYSHLVSLSVLAGHLGLVVMAKRGGDRTAHWAFAASATFGVSFVLPMLASGSGQSGQIAWNNPTFQDLVEHPQELFGSWVTGGSIMAIGVLGLFAARKYAVLLAPWVLLPPILTYLTSDQLHLFLPRYLLFTVPAWVLLAAAAVTRIAGPLTGEAVARAGAGRRVVGALLVLATAVAFGWQAQPGIAIARKNDSIEPDYRKAAQIVAREQQAGDGIAFSGVMSERRAMAYELRHDTGRPKDVLLYRTPQEIGGFGGLECSEPVKCLAGTDRLWVVSTSQLGTPFADMSARTATALKRYFKVAHTDNLANARVLLLERVR
jgi:mannosyltransferase